MNSARRVSDVYKSVRVMANKLKLDIKEMSIYDDETYRVELSEPKKADKIGFTRDDR